LQLLLLVLQLLQLLCQLLPLLPQVLLQLLLTLRPAGSLLAVLLLHCRQPAGSICLHFFHLLVCLSQHLLPLGSPLCCHGRLLLAPGGGCCCCLRLHYLIPGGKLCQLALCRISMPCNFLPPGSFNFLPPGSFPGSFLQLALQYLQLSCLPRKFLLQL